MRRGPLVAIVLIGVGLVAAPAVFGMFTRAPAGGRMLDAFEPFMHAEVIDGFGGYLDRVDAAAAELAPDALGYARSDPQLAAFLAGWEGIGEQMREMLATIEANFDNYAAVAALPPFALFPWFFVVPGVLLVALAWRGLAASRRKEPARRVRVALGILGIGLFAAPLLFGMYTRAPLGGEMISDFSTLMTTERITEVQRDFLTLAGGEGALRTRLLPALRGDGMADAAVADQLPATVAFVEVWPEMSREMAPMMGTMNDQLTAFAGIAALPPFPLFPWFFAIPGVLVLALALAAGRPARVREHVPAPAILALVLLLGLTACGGTDEEPAGTEDTQGPPSGVLSGVLRLTGGECAEGGVTAGSSFRMVQPGGTLAEGPYVENADSPCADKSWTPLLPGSDGGLRLGDYQPLPEPAFDESGHALAGAVTQPSQFFAVNFGVATNRTDPQTQTEVPAPTVEVGENGVLAADLSAWAVAWNGEHFNQGSPKPDGTHSEHTTAVTGTYDRDTGTLTLEWSSQIVGGAFNNFTGLWRLEGTLG